MDNKELKKKLVSMRNSIQDYLDNLDMDEVDEKPEKAKKPEKGKKPDKPGEPEKDGEED